MQRPSASSGPTVPPKYACPCLNVKIFDITSPNGRSSTPPAPLSGWEAVCVDASSIQTAYEQLTLKSRSPEHGAHVVCLLCNIIVYRILEGGNSMDTSSSSVTSPVGISTSLMSPTTRERPDFQKLFQKNKDNQAWIQVNTRGGCISGRQLEDTVSKASPIFGLNIPIIETISPAPTPPSSTVPLPSPSATGPNAGTGSNLTASMSHQLNLNWPEFIPPPPFVPSHPLYAHLARIGKKASSSARTDAEAAIQSFIYAKRKEVAEYEAGLRRQVNTVWRVWRDSMEKERPTGNANSSNAGFSVADPRSNIKRHATNASTSSTTSATAAAGPSQKATVIRNFEEDTSISPRVSDSHYIASSSSFSPSTATPRVQPRMSALGTSLIQSGMHMPRPRPTSSSSPSTAAAEPLSPRRTGEKASAARSSSRTPPGNSNIGMQSRGSKGHSEEKQKPLPNDNSAMSPTGANSSITRGSNDVSAKDNGSGKKKGVTWSSKEPDVVTVARDIKSEKLQKMHEEHAKGEEPMFDLDIEGDEESKTSRSDTRTAYSGPNSSSITEKAPPNRRITGFDAVDETEPGVTVSFKNRSSQYTMARSLPQARHGILASTSLGVDGQIPGPHSVQDQSLLSSDPLAAAPHNNELLKLVAGQTPTHRTAWIQEDEESDEDESEDGSDEDDEDEETSTRAMDIQSGSANGSQTDETRVVSKSVAMDIPPMKPIVQPAKAADNGFENAMSKSHDPGPALEMLTLDGRDEDDEEDEENDKPSDTNATNGEVGADGATTEEADLMKRLMEGRGSLHAQKILRVAERSAPASRWSGNA